MGDMEVPGFDEDVSTAGLEPMSVLVASNDAQVRPGSYYDTVARCKTLRFALALCESCELCDLGQGAVSCGKANGGDERGVSVGGIGGL